MTRAERKKELKSKIACAVVCGAVSFGWMIPVGIKYHEDYVIKKPVVEEPAVVETETEIIRWKENAEVTHEVEMESEFEQKNSTTADQS